MRLALTPSGLTIDRVRSSAIRFDLSENQVSRRYCGGSAAARQAAQFTLGSALGAIWPSLEVPVRQGVFADAAMADATLWAPARPKDQTEKLSPQPHSPLTFGFLKRNASFSPCFTKSTTVPSISARLAASTNTRTPRSSKIASPGCGPSA